MAYNKKTWVTGETIEATDLNNMENGIEAAQNNEDLEAEIKKLQDDMVDITDAEIIALFN